MSKSKASVASEKNKSLTSTKHFYEVARERSFFDLLHSHGPFGDGEVRGQVGQHVLAGDMVAGQGKYGVASDSGEDHTVKRGGDELVFCTWRQRRDS